jgi:hypothetical protein
MAESNKSNQPGEAKKSAMARLLSSIKFLVEPGLPVEERRIGGRLECSLETSYVSEMGDSGEAVVLDISRRGLRIRTSGSVTKGLTLALKPPSEFANGDFAPLMARVMWSKKDDDGYLAGLLLPPGSEDEETWLEAFLVSKGYGVGGPQRRKYVRADSELPGRLNIRDEPTMEVTVLNLGLGGALIRCEPVLEKMSPFRLHLGPYEDLPELEISGTILRHSKGDDSEPWTYHSSRFGPLEERRHSLLKEYVVKLLRKAREEKRKNRKTK